MYIASLYKSIFPTTFFIPLDFDFTNIFQLGEFGLYQRFLFIMLMLFCFFLTFVYFTQLFLIVVPVEFWCEMPIVEGFTSEEIRDYMVPSSYLVAYEGHDLAYSRCWIYDVPVKIAMEAKEPDPNWPMKKCHEWHFKTSPFDVPYISVAAEFGWVTSPHNLA